MLYIPELVKAARAARHGKTAGESNTAETAQDSVEYFRDRVRLAIRNDADLRESGDIIEDYFDTYLNESEDHDVQEHFHHYVTDRRTREEDTIVKDEELDPQRPSASSTVHLRKIAAPSPVRSAA